VFFIGVQALFDLGRRQHVYS